MIGFILEINKQQKAAAVIVKTVGSEKAHAWHSGLGTC